MKDLPVIVRTSSGYAWQINKQYQVVRLSFESIRIDNDRTMLSTHAHIKDGEQINYVNEGLVPNYIQKKIPQFIRLTNKYYL